MKTLFTGSRSTGSDARSTRWGVLGSSVATVALIAGPLAIDIGSKGATGFIGSAFALKPGCEAPPCGGGGGGNPPPNPGGGGGKPDFPGRGQGDAYSDLVKLYRDVTGRPILIQKELLPEEPGGESPGTVFCEQPVSAGPVDGLVTVVNPADGKTVSFVELGGAGLPGEECDVDPTPANVALVQETLFGRLNLGRSPEKVLAQQLRDVTASLAGSVLPVDIEEVGRFVWYPTDLIIDGVEVDSPGQNLALTKELQVFGLPLTDQTGTAIPTPDVPNLNDPTNFVDHAASELGAAAGKGDLVDLDLVVYNNRILGIPDGTASTGVLATVLGGEVAACPADAAGASVDGDCQYGEILSTGPEVYIDYADYGYIRSEVFPGCVTGLLADFPTPGVFTPVAGTIMDCAFGTITHDVVNNVAVCAGGVDFTGATAVHNFAQRADDARAVIAFVHDNAISDSTAILPANQAGVDQAGKDAVCDEL